MKVSFHYRRNQGTIEIDEQGGVVIEADNHDIAQRIKEIVQDGVETLVPFKNPNVPGKIRTKKKIIGPEDFTLALEILREKLEIWIVDNEKPLDSMPWFSKEGFKMIRWNDNPDNPWFLIEDIATGMQTFVGPGTKGSELLWHRKSILESGLVDHWKEFNEKFRDLDDIPYC